MAAAVAVVAAAVEIGTKSLRVLHTSGLPIRQPRYFLPRIAHQRDAFLGPLTGRTVQSQEVFPYKESYVYVC